jgi:hypothetical protein
VNGTVDLQLKVGDECESEGDTQSHPEAHAVKQGQTTLGSVALGRRHLLEANINHQSLSERK